jgi:PTS system nitrogen regulatory IIA component
MAKRPDNDEILTLTEIAGYLKVSEKTILRMVQSGQFPGVKVSNQWRFVRAIVDDWLSARMQSAPTASLLDVVGTGLQVIPLTRLVSNKRIILRVKPGKRVDILAQLVEPLEKDGIVSDRPDYLGRLVAREEVVSTAIGHGLAVPHVREPEDSPVTTPCIVVGICREGTDFGALDGDKTHLFAMPCAGTESAHLRLIARISLLFRRPGVLSAMTAARTKKAVMAILAEADRDLTAREISGNPMIETQEK